MKKDEMIGREFGLLKVVKEGDKFHQPSGQTQKGYVCQCKCGRQKRIRKSHLVHGRVKSCGCIMPPNIIKDKRLYNTWRGMICRTRHSANSTNKRTKCYIGIGVIEEWNSFNKFASWALNNGWDDCMTIDRIDNYKGYSPDNCRFVTRKENASNKKKTIFVDYRGERVKLTEVIERNNLESKSSQVYRHIRQGKNIDSFLTKIRKVSRNGGNEKIRDNHPSHPHHER